MEIYGKKQIDIREDNKSAVIDLLLKSEVTVLELSSALDLSHTAIAKVIKELLQKNVVEVIKLVAKGTIEEKIVELQAKKQYLRFQVIEGENRDQIILSKLTEEEIRDILNS